MAAVVCWWLPANAAAPVTACAIRWDAWYSNGASDPGHFTAETLSKPQWHELAPLHARFDAAGTITWAASQQTFDAEIRAAHSAHLCWAYLMYGTGNIIDLTNPLMRGLQFHRASAIGASVNYAMMTTSGLLGRADHYQAAVDATTALMRDGNYQRVVVDRMSRPLLFLLYDPRDLAGLFQGALAKMRAAVDALRRSSEQEGLGNPYIVVLFGPAPAAEALRRALDADAISQYIAGTRRGDAQSWASFAPSIAAEWDAYAAATNEGVVPTLRTGADIRARCETPPPFDHRFAFGHCDSFVANPTAGELVAEFRAAITWVGQHLAHDPTRLLLVYSWSECDESGNCLMPTIGDPTGRKLEALSAILSPQ